MEIYMCTIRTVLSNKDIINNTSFCHRFMKTIAEPAFGNNCYKHNS